MSVQDPAHARDVSYDPRGPTPEPPAPDRAEPRDAPTPDPRELLDATLTIVSDQVRRHPYAALGVGLGVGWVLGHGLPPSLLRIAGEAALRAAVLPPTHGFESS
jgi:hypothetical protein